MSNTDPVVIDPPAGAASDDPPANLPKGGEGDPPAPEGENGSASDGQEGNALDLSNAGWTDIAKALAAGDEKLEARLSSFTDIGAFDKALRDTQTQLRNSGRVIVPDENADEATLKAWNEARGVPVKPDGYEDLPQRAEGEDLSETDTAMLTQIRDRLHSKGGMFADPAVMKEMHQVYYDMVDEREAQMAADIAAAAEATAKNLQTEYRGDYKRNLQIANAAAKSMFGEHIAEIQDLMSVVVLDPKTGKPQTLGDHEGFVRAMVAYGRRNVDDPNLMKAMGMSSGDVTSLKAEHKRIMALRRGSKSDVDEYNRLAAEGGELERIERMLARAEQSG